MSKKHQDDKIRLGISVGDLNGIGMEIIIKTFMDNRMMQNLVPIVYASSKVASYHKKSMEIEDFDFNIVKSPEQAVANKANLVNAWEDDVKIELGKASAETGKCAYISLKRAVEDLAANKIDVLVTAPIHKDSIQSEEFNFPGHTEFLADYSNTDEYLMIMLSDNLRIGVVTGHIPLSEVAKNLSKEDIVQKIKVMHNSLVRDFGIIKPKIAIMGLNPHAGEKGLLGEEESKIIEPAIAEAKKQGYLAYGPYPADGFFGSSNFKNFDGVLAMYHDQGLVPFKALSFGKGVNYTAGLPIVRTSPDHGTGFEIAGKNMADPSSFRQAIYTACDVFKSRQMHREMNENPLEIAPPKKR